LDCVSGLVGEVPTTAFGIATPLDHPPRIDQATALGAMHFHDVRVFHDAAAVYRLAVDPMPEPGDLIAAFSPQPDRCFRMIQS